MNRVRRWFLPLSGLLLISPLCGCVATHPVTTWELNDRVADHRATVTLHNGDEYRADSLIIDQGYASWLEPETRDVLEIPTYEVKSVAVVDHGQGAVRGIEAGLGVTMDAVSSTEGAHPIVQVAAVAIGLALIPVFAIVGAVFGVRDVYQISDGPDSTSSNYHVTIVPMDCDTRPPFACRDSTRAEE